jgi:TetR/AcrR family transcriptional regulator, tetracycline repressor protein
MTRETLKPARIVELALEIVDREGLEALNMRRLATQAGVKPMSLYHHFPSKDAILDAIGEALAATALSAAGPVGSWQDRVRRQFSELHELVRRHPRALPLISRAVIHTPSGRRWMEELMQTLLDAGFDPAGAAAVYHSLGAYTLGLGYAGLLSLETPLGAITGDPSLTWSDFPALLKVGLRLAVWDRAGEFEAGLDVLLSHFAAGLANA